MALSFDIQKRAEEILKGELRAYFKRFFKEDRLDKVVENAFYIKEEYACVISAMQKLATEAVAAEREKYEKEIADLKSKLQECEHKIAIEAQIAEDIEEGMKAMEWKDEKEIIEIMEALDEIANEELRWRKSHRMIETDLKIANNTNEKLQQRIRELEKQIYLNQINHDKL